MTEKPERPGGTCRARYTPEADFFRNPSIRLRACQCYVEACGYGLDVSWAGGDRKTAKERAGELTGVGILSHRKRIIRDLFRRRQVLAQA